MENSEIDLYIATYEEHVRQRLQAIRQLVETMAPDAVFKMAFGMPQYKYRGKVLLYFAGHKHHIGLYPMPPTISAFEKELASYRSGKGSVQFPHSEPLPIELIRQILEYRIFILTAGKAL